MARPTTVGNYSILESPRKCASFWMSVLLVASSRNFVVSFFNVCAAGGLWALGFGERVRWIAVLGIYLKQHDILSFKRAIDWG